MLRLIIVSVLVTLCCFTQLCTAQQGELSGKITDGDTGEGLPFASVYVVVDDLPRGAQADIDGFYSIKPIPAGVYTLTVEYIGYQKQMIDKVPVSTDQIGFVDVALQEDYGPVDAVIVDYYPPILVQDDKSKESLPTRNANVISSACGDGVYQENEGSDLRIGSGTKHKFGWRIKRLFKPKSYKEPFTIGR